MATPQGLHHISRPELPRLENKMTFLSTLEKLMDKTVRCIMCENSKKANEWESMIVSVGGIYLDGSISGKTKREVN